MPETVTVTYLARSRFPASLTIHVPGTERLDKNGEPEAGTGSTVTFIKGKSMDVPASVADMVLNGPAGMLKLTVQDGLPVLSRAFVEGSIDEERKNDPAAINEKVESLQTQFADLLKLIKASGVSPEALKSLGIGAGEDDSDAGEPIGKQVKNVDEFTITDGGFERDDSGRLLCPHCRDWATVPMSADFDEKRAKRSLNAHIRMAHKELFETDESDT